MATNYPSTYNWQDTWSLQAVATGTQMGETTNEVEFTIESAGGAWNAFGLMSVKKVTNSEGLTVFWWGYSTQVNMGTNLVPGNVVQQFLTTQGQDIKYPGATKMNFYCEWTKQSAGAVAGSGSTDKDCGTNDVSSLFSQDSGTPATVKGDFKGYDTKAACPTSQLNSNFMQNQVYKFSNTWYYHTCMNMRSSQDSAASVAAVEIGQTIKFRAGYKIWSSATGGLVHSKTMTSWNEYTIQDSSTSLFAGLGAVVAATIMF